MLIMESGLSSVRVRHCHFYVGIIYRCNFLDIHNVVLV